MTLEIDFGTGLPVFAILFEKLIGSKFQLATTDFKNSGDAGAYAAQNNEFEIKDFLVGVDPFNSVLEIESTIYNQVLLSSIYTVQIISSTTAGNGSIKFQILDYAGVPISGALLNQNFDKIVLTLNLNSL